jgi:DNA-binding GntR family transcriptional regulator
MATEQTFFQLPKVEAVRTLKEQAYETIKEAILSMQLEPGYPLVEEELAHQLGVSKTPVRDALNDLERDGLVTRILFKGTYVSEISARDAEEIFQLRAVLEGLAFRLATPHLTSDDLAQAQELLNAADKALQQGNLPLCSKLGTQFHWLVIRKSTNQRLFPILDNLENLTCRLRLVSGRIYGRMEKSSSEHCRIMDALKQGDPLAAEQALRDHLHSVLRDIGGDQEDRTEPEETEL